MKYLLLIALGLHMSWAQTSVTKYGTACEGGTISLECPPGEVIHVVRGFYGRTNALTCSDRNMNDQNCVSESSQYIVSNSCNFKQNCSLYASSEVFGDPCEGTSKYMDVVYNCLASDIQTVISCDGRPIGLSCPPGKVLEIIKANYGRTDAVTCPNKEMSNKNCHATGSTLIVKSICDCKRACSVSPKIFGDPCFGTSKYLDIQYHCISPCKCKKHTSDCKPKKSCCEKRHCDCNCDCDYDYEPALSDSNDPRRYY